VFFGTGLALVLAFPAGVLLGSAGIADALLDGIGAAEVEAAGRVGAGGCSSLASELGCGRRHGGGVTRRG